MNDKQLNKRAYEVWAEDLTAKQKADKLNKEFGLTWATRTWQQRSKNYSIGLEDGIEDSSSDEELERIAKARAKAMREQKIATLMRNPVHKEARAAALEKAILDKVYSITNLPKYNVRAKITIPNIENRVIEFVISDLHFKGGELEQEHVAHIFNTIRESAKAIKFQKNDEFRLVFLGDELEGDSAHESQLAQAEDVVAQITQLIPLLVEGCNEVYNAIDCEYKSLVFVPYSNHGLAYGRQKDRYQFPKSDYGLILLAALKMSINKDVHIYEVDNERMVVETWNSIYLHGHQGFARKEGSKIFLETLGVDKDIDMGHLHHYEEHEDRNRVVTKFPTCRCLPVDYERIAGYLPHVQITARIRAYHYDACLVRHVKRIKV